MRLSFAAALFGAALIVAPPASAQGAPSLLTSVGSPLPYRIDLPREWEITRGSQVLNTGRVHVLAASSGDLSVAVIASDLVEDGQDRIPGVSDAEMRRIMTDMFASSDSLLLGLMQASIAAMKQEARVRDVVREIRTLGGQRAAYMRARFERGGKWYSVEMYAAVKDGVVYVLRTTAGADERAAHEPLFARIRDSLRFAAVVVDDVPAIQETC
jgi:hypothetical protein